MDKKMRKIPKFRNIKEEARFWDTHSFADYWDEVRGVKMVYKPTSENKETMTLRIAPSLKREVEKVAKGYDMATSTLIRMWVVDKLKTLKASQV